MTVLELLDVSKRVGPSLELAGINASVATGELVALLGPTGSGKTSLLRAIAGLDPLDSGEIRLAGEVLTQGSEIRVPPHRRGIALVFQETLLLPFATVEKNVLLGMHGKEQEQDTGARLEQVCGLLRIDDLRPRPVTHLSGGEQQRVAVARALITRPRIILLDEPFSNLDHELKQELLPELLAHLAEQGTTTLFVTHDRAEALSFVQRSLLLEDGRLGQEKPPVQLPSDASGE